MPATISSITGESILDSRGVPTLSVTVHASDGSVGTFSVPSGASTGIHEAHELRDDGTSHGGVEKALSILAEEIAPALVGMNVFAQEEIDRKMIELDGTPNKERLGGNTMIGVSIACAKASARSHGKEVWQYLHDAHFADTAPALPLLYANLINGGKHAQTALAFQEYHVVPKSQSPQEASDIISLVQEKLGEIILERYGEVARGDEGGYAVPEVDVETPLILLEEAAHRAGVADNITFALDVAASSFWDEGSQRYHIAGNSYDASALSGVYQKLSSLGRVLSIEDPFNEEDFASFAMLRKSIPETLVVGDDLTTTSYERLKKAVEEKSIDAIIIKPNQIGTLTETIQTMKFARENGIKCIVSHRSGETLDDFIADLAYASGAFGLKLGARGPLPREAKYSRLLTIEKSFLHHEN